MSYSEIFTEPEWQAAIDGLPADRRDNIVEEFSIEYRGLVGRLAAEVDSGTLKGFAGQTWNHLLEHELRDEHAIRLSIGCETTPLWKVALDQSTLNATNDDLK